MSMCHAEIERTESACESIAEIHFLSACFERAFWYLCDCLCFFFFFRKMWACMMKSVKMLRTEDVETEVAGIAILNFERRETRMAFREFL